MMTIADLAMMKRYLSFAIRRCRMWDGGIIMFSQVERSAKLSVVGSIVSGS